MKHLALVALAGVLFAADPPIVDQTYVGDIDLGTIKGKLFQDKDGNFRILLDVPVTRRPPPPPKPRPPAAPSKLTAKVADKDVALAWQDNSTNEDLFVIQRGEVVWKDVGVADANVVKYVDKGLSAGPYSYRVLARNKVGDSGLSNTVAVVIKGEPPVANAAPIIRPYFHNNPKFDSVTAEKYAAISAKVGKAINVTIPIYDADGDPIAVLVSPLGTQARLYPLTSALTNHDVDATTMATYDGGAFTFWIYQWTPTQAEKTLKELTVTASDGKTQTSETVPLTVMAP